MDPRDLFGKVLSAIEDHHRWFNSALPMIASENVTSPSVRRALVSDFGHRYAEGWVGERVYAGTKYIDLVESLAMDLIKDLY
ncbi:MAG: serine hydroxymethyltransferase, partial [Thermoproteota archaeon]